MPPLFLSLIRERQIHRHIYREKHRESDNLERNKGQRYGSNCKSVNKLNRMKNNFINVSSTFMVKFFRSCKYLIRRPLPHKGKMR